MAELEGTVLVLFGDLLKVNYQPVWIEYSLAVGGKQSQGSG